MCWLGWWGGWFSDVRVQRVGVFFSYCLLHYVARGVTAGKRAGEQWVWGAAFVILDTTDWLLVG